MSRAHAIARWGTVRLPWEPVAAHLDRQAGEPLAHIEHARQLGLNFNQVYRWRRAAGRSRCPPVVTPQLEGVHAEADRVAVGLGMHPFELWGDDWWAS